MSIHCGKCYLRHPVEVADSPEFVLLHSVLDNDIPEIEKVVEQDKNLLKHIYKPACDLPILLMAISDDRVKPETVEKLLDHGADITARSELNEGWRALHFAAQRANSEVLRVILEHREPQSNDNHQPNTRINIEPAMNVNRLANGNNALHILVKQGCDKPNGEKKQSVNYEEGQAARGQAASEQAAREQATREEQEARCAKLLIKDGINVNQEDDKNRTPIFCAALNGLKHIVEVILGNEKRVDLDSSDVEGKTARSIISEKSLYNPELLPNTFTQNRTDIEILFRYIRSNNQDGFIAHIREASISALGNTELALQASCGKKLRQVVQYLIEKGNIREAVIYSLVNEDNTELTLLQASCGKKLTKVVRYLIENGANPNKKGPDNNKFPIEIAVQNHSSEIVKVLLETRSPQNFKISLPPTILNDVLKYIDHKENKECYDIIKESHLEDLKILVNSCDPSTKNTPLHFAVRYGEDTHVEELLNLGASLGAKNCFEWMPIQDMKAEILEKHLDNCIKFDKSKVEEINKEEFTVTFDYNSLIPPREKPDVKCKSNKRDKNDRQKRLCALLTCHNWCRKERTATNRDGEQGIELQALSGNNEQATAKPPPRARDELLPETDVVEYISQAPEFKHLLKHPVIVSFLVIKWHRICWLFYWNFLFYFIFCLSLVGYIFSHYTDFGEGGKSNARGFLGGLFYFVFFATFFILVFRDLFQIVVSHTKYLKNIKNYVKLPLIIAAGFILFWTEPSINTKKLVAVISILLSALEFLIILGQHPWCSANVVMLLKVSVTFLKFLSWYLAIILAFAMSFHILFTQAGQNNTNITTGEKDEDFFKNLSQSMFKTIIMLTGEFDASSINFQTFPVTSKLIFSLFILTIVIILMNLLNSLAVNDMEKIRDNAEYMSRAQHVSYVESMFLGNVFSRNFLKWIKEACWCVPKDLNSNYMLKVYLNKSGKIVMDVDKKNKPEYIQMKFCICNCFQRLFQNGSQISFFDSETSRKTRDIIFEKIKRK